MIDCNKAGQLIEQGEFEKIGWLRKRKLKLHLKVCHICKKYEEDNSVLSKIIKLAGSKYTNRCLSQEEKERIKERLAANEQ